MVSQFRLLLDTKDCDLKSQKLDTEIACGNDLIFCLSVRVFFDGIHFVKRREIFDRFFRRRRRRDVDDIHVGCFWQSRRCQIVLEIGDVDVCVVGQSIVLQLSINQDLQIFFYSHCRICIFCYSLLLGF